MWLMPFKPNMVHMSWTLDYSLNDSLGAKTTITTFLYMLRSVAIWVLGAKTVFVIHIYVLLKTLL